MLTTGSALTWSMDSTAVVHRDSMGTDVKKVFFFFFYLFPSTKLNSRKKDIDIFLKKYKEYIKLTLFRAGFFGSFQTREGSVPPTPVTSRILYFKQQQ